MATAVLLFSVAGAVVLGGNRTADLHVDASAKDARKDARKALREGAELDGPMDGPDDRIGLTQGALDYRQHRFGTFHRASTPRGLTYNDDQMPNFPKVPVQQFFASLLASQGLDAATATCAIVGNSGRLLLSQRGAEIDAYDAVFRLDDGPAGGAHEGTAGSKTTVRVMAKGVWSQDSAPDAQLNLIQGVSDEDALLEPLPDSDRHTVGPEPTASMARFYSRRKAGKNDYLLQRAFERSVGRVFFGASGEAAPGAYPTADAGAFALAVASQVCGKSVTLYELLPGTVPAAAGCARTYFGGEAAQTCPTTADPCWGAGPCAAQRYQQYGSDTGETGVLAIQGEGLADLRSNVRLAYETEAFIFYDDSSEPR